MGTKHTPEPWTIEKLVNVVAISPHDGKGFTVATTETFSAQRGATREEREANAAHIVRCVNNHQRMLLALKELRRWIPQWMEGEEVESVLADLDADIFAAEGQAVPQ